MKVYCPLSKRIFLFRKLIHRISLNYIPREDTVTQPGAATPPSESSWTDLLTQFPYL